MGEAKAALSNVFQRIAAAAHAWGAAHMLFQTGNSATIVLAAYAEKRRFPREMVVRLQDSHLLAKAAEKRGFSGQLRSVVHAWSTGKIGP